MTDIRERHGVPDARKVNECYPTTQVVHVTDGDQDEVLLMIGTGTHPAGLTPAQARFLARQLDQSAARIEFRMKEEKK